MKIYGFQYSIFSLNQNSGTAKVSFQSPEQTTKFQDSTLKTVGEDPVSGYFLENHNQISHTQCNRMNFRDLKIR